ncbi:transposase [Clostridium sp. AWRP]|uniref:transposase n=1 Tax=Clostridium sp. AWRP TaxID=2212991 RepID=UPI0026C17D6C
MQITASISGFVLKTTTGIDAPPYQSGQFTGTNRKISKRGSSILRKIGYETMQVLKTHTALDDDAVYWYILKKETEGKPKRIA